MKEEFQNWKFICMDVFLVQNYYGMGEVLGVSYRMFRKQVNIDFVLIK